MTERKECSKDAEGGEGPVKAAPAVLYNLKEDFAYAWCPSTQQNVYFSIGCAEFVTFPFHLLLPGQLLNITTVGKLPRHAGVTDTRATHVTGVMKASGEVVFGIGVVTEVHGEGQGMSGRITTAKDEYYFAPGWAHVHRKGNANPEGSLSSLLGKSVHFMALKVDPTKRGGDPHVIQFHPEVTDCTAHKSKKLLSHWHEHKEATIKEHQRASTERLNKINNYAYSPKNYKEHVTKAMLTVTNEWDVEEAEKLISQCEDIFLYAAFSDDISPPDRETAVTQLKVLIDKGVHTN